MNDLDQIEGFIIKFIDNLYPGNHWDSSFGSLHDMGLTKSDINELKIIIEEEYGIDMEDFLDMDDTISRIAEKISDSI